jgi:hypothetical protein
MGAHGGAICLVARGICTFKAKLKNCADAGAKLMVLYNSLGSSTFMIGPDLKYTPTGIGVVTVDNSFFTAVQPFLPNVTAVIEPQAVDFADIIDRRNCTAEAVGLGPVDKAAAVSKCEAEIQSSAGADAAADTVDGLYSGKMVADAMGYGTESDDPYSICIMEAPCLDNWHTQDHWMVAVFTTSGVLLLSFCQITSMCCFGHSKEPMKGRKPRLKLCARPARRRPHSHQAHTFMPDRAIVLHACVFRRTPIYGGDDIATARKSMRHPVLWLRLR